MLALFLILMGAACCVLYLSLGNQGWLVRPLPTVPWRIAGAIGVTLALECAMRAFSTITAVFAWMAVGMLLFSLLPFASLVLHGKGRRERR